jgi:DNA-binding NarL/FixJ family response regulator
VCPAAFATGPDAVAALGPGPHPDIVLLDIELPGMSGLDAIPLIRAAAPAVRVIILTVFEDDDKIFRAICAGAAGYLLKLAPVEELVATIEQVRGGGAPLNARIAERVLRMFTTRPNTPEPYGLSDREREVLELLVNGLTKKEVAARLGLSVHTVTTYVRNVYEKLHVHTRSQAVAKALREKLV